MNQIIWNKVTLKIVRSFPDAIKKEAGYLLYKLQAGELLAMPHSRAMPSVGSGIFELRIRGEDGSYRIFYYTKLENKILVFHAFKKKTHKTSKTEIETGKQNLKGILNEED